MNDGDFTGLKQDRFRNSRFEYDSGPSTPPSGVMSRTLNTLGGAYEENRGRRNASERLHRRDDNPFVNGRLYKWNHRQGWDTFYDRAYDKERSRSYGGGQLDHDGAHVGKGPRGYKRSDEDVYHDVCQMLTLTDVDASDIEVSVKDGCVFLNGTVESRGAKKMAELAIENISGVLDVQNLLTFQKPEQTTPQTPQGTREKLENRH